MRYLQFVCTDPEAEPYRPELDNIQEWAAEFGPTGAIVDGDRLRPAEEATTVRVRQGKVLVSDGPFAESKEWIAGFDILECPDLDAAIRVASKHPMARFGRIEVRPFADKPGVPVVRSPIPADHSKLFLQFLCTDPEAEAYLPEEDHIEAWVAEMVTRGLLIQGQLLAPVEAATLVRVRGGKVLVTDGPFAETKEWVNGFGILACRDLAEAVEVSSRHPAARFGRVELRAFWPFA